MNQLPWADVALAGTIEGADPGVTSKLDRMHDTHRVASMAMTNSYAVAVRIGADIGSVPAQMRSASTGMRADVATGGGDSQRSLTISVPAAGFGAARPRTNQSQHHAQPPHRPALRTS